jgi:endo-1,4-beta-xylanase
VICMNGTSRGEFWLIQRLHVVCRLAALACVLLTTPSCAAEPSAEAYFEKNRAALDQARLNIEKHRKGFARIMVTDDRGRPIGGARVRVRQISHDFLFGCYLKLDDLAPSKRKTYEQYFSRLFNYAVVGNYWDAVERTPGSEDLRWFNEELATARRLGMKVQVAPILWGTNTSGTPSWLPGSETELRKVLERRVQQTISRYRGRVRDWEVANEHLAKERDLFAARLGDGYIASAFMSARAADPSARLLINEYGVFGSVAEFNYNREKYVNLVRRLTSVGVPIDVVGIQAHARGEWYAPANVAEQLHVYAALGKPIQITEFSVQTREYDDRVTPKPIYGTYRSGTWDDTKQAEFYREFYTVAFGEPAVEAIVTWGLDDERAWLPGIGLIDANGDPKDAFKVLDDLINREWRTQVESVTSADGIIDLTGFYGQYEISVDGARAPRQMFHLQRGVANEWKVRIHKQDV